MSEEINYFTEGLTNLNWQNFVMYGIGFLLIFLAIKKKYEPMLLLPIGFGAILVNLPLEILWDNLVERSPTVSSAQPSASCRLTTDPK